MTIYLQLIFLKLMRLAFVKENFLNPFVISNKLNKGAIVLNQLKVKKPIN